MDLGVFLVKPGRYHHFVFVLWKRPWVVVVCFGPKAYVMIQLRKLTLTSLTWSLSDEFSLYEFSYPKPCPYFLGHSFEFPRLKLKHDGTENTYVLDKRTELYYLGKRIRLKSNAALRNVRQFLILHTTTSVSCGSGIFLPVRCKTDLLTYVV